MGIRVVVLWSLLACVFGTHAIADDLSSIKTDSCLIVLPGDVIDHGAVTAADIVYMIGFVFKGGLALFPCYESGDVNCDGTVNSSDIVYLVGYVFKGGTPPCDICIDSPIGDSCT